MTLAYYKCGDLTSALREYKCFDRFISDLGVLHTYTQKEHCEAFSCRRLLAESQKHVNVHNSEHFIDTVPAEEHYM